MKCLLDTNILLWLVAGAGLSQTVRESILDEENQLCVSIVSYWEICLKISIGKLILPDNWQKSIARAMLTNDVQWLPIEKVHCEKLIELPFYHKDPFDRLIIAQAICENFSIVSSDSHFLAYEVSVVW